MSAIQAVSLGSAISTRRKELGWTQKQLAQQVLKEDGTSITPQFLNDVERDRRRPSALVLQRIAEALQWTGAEADRLHYLAGTMPPDIDLEKVGQQRWEQAIKAFRKK